MYYRMLLTCCLMIWPLLSSVHAKENILIVTEEWVPYNYMENGEITGTATDIVKHILKELNKSYDIEMLPSARSLYQLNNRPRTMMFSMFRTPEREPRYQWIGPLADGAVYFYKNKDAQLTIKSPEDLKNPKLSICTRHAGSIHDLLVKQGFSNLDTLATDGLSIYQKLLAGRCDIAISDTDLGVRHILKTLGLRLEDVFEKIPFPAFEAKLYLAASKDIPETEIQLWQSALDAMKTSGSYDEIVQKYR